MADVSYPAALIAGLISFLSPCVLPLAPPYLCFLAGTSVQELAEGGERRARVDVMIGAALFVAGFSTVFVALGATASAFGQILRDYSQALGFVAGLAIIVMGLHFLGLVRIGAMFREKRLEVQKPAGLWSAYLMGLAFAFGWTPCIGPILAAILAVAGAEESVTKGALLLAIYSLGLGVPFLLAAAAMGPFMRFLARFRAHMPKVEKAAGALLVLTGFAFITGGMQAMSFWLLETFPALGRLG
ncbi:MAG: sulfite exporter TauE/SafE family protein [Methylobacteriaceae bacterium]|nr:sulfite exporter TauE/SafE family protein [Methylobacteriaceae bacterium]